MAKTMDAVTIARENIEAFNLGDKQRFGANLTPDSVYRELATGREARGVDEGTNTSFSWRDAFPDAHGEITNSFASGDQAMLQITWTGTHKGDLVSPAGTIPATGKRVTIPACQVITIHDGKIVRTDHYFDLMTMLVQLGVTPAQQPV
jgi:steroid delta-isomerase-like uncharacterized protein